VEPEEKLGRADPEQSRTDHVREPVRVMSHTAEAVKQRERIDGRGYVPRVVVVLAQPAARPNIGATSPETNDRPP
jgi:hypothetical protein